MPTQLDDRMLWILVGVGLFIAAKAIPEYLEYVRQLTQVKSEDVPPQRSHEDVEHALKTETLQKLAAGRSYEIRSSAIKIISERCITGPALFLLFEDLASKDVDRRDKAIHALKLFVSHRSLRDSPKLSLIATGQAFHAIITALVNLLPQHETTPTGTVGDDEGKVECFEMDYGLPIMAQNRFETYVKRADQMAREYAETPKGRALLYTIPARQEQLLALTGLTSLTEYFFNKYAYQWFREDNISVATLDSVPDVTDELRRLLHKICCSTKDTEALSGWRREVSAVDRVRHVESLLTVLWSCRSIAVQASSLATAISTERDAIFSAPGRDIYDAICEERADYFRRLTGGIYQQALESSASTAVRTGGLDPDKCENRNSKGSVLPLSPVRPSHRPPQERTLLFILTKLIKVDRVGIALDNGLVSRWLYRYPFPCMLTGSKQHDVVALLRRKTWGNDDPIMAELMYLITAVESGLQQLHEYGLTNITNFHGYSNGGNWYGEHDTVLNHDAEMTGGEDAAGIFHSTGQSDQDQRPESSWSRSHPTDSHSEEFRRRRRREAMVLSEWDEPLTEGNILQRENSHAALVPGGRSRVEEQPAQPWQVVDEDEYEIPAFQDPASSRQAARPREPLADITALDQ